MHDCNVACMGTRWHGYSVIDLVTKRKMQTTSLYSCYKYYIDFMHGMSMSHCSAAFSKIFWEEGGNLRF